MLIKPRHLLPNSLPVLHLDLPRNTQPMRLTLIVMVHNLQPKIAAALRERRPYIRNFRVPLPAELAVHQVLRLVVLQPHVRLQPIRAEPAALSADARLSGGAFRAQSRRLDHRTFLRGHAGGRMREFRRNGQRSPGDRRRLLHALALRDRLVFVVSGYFVRVRGPRRIKVVFRGSRPLLRVPILTVFVCFGLWGCVRPPFLRLLTKKERICMNMLSHNFTRLFMKLL